MEALPKNNCIDVVMEDALKLVPHPRNPNKHPEEQLRLLSAIIEYQGWRYPIVVSNRSGFVISGHARLEVALRSGWSTVPVSRQKFDDEAQEWAHLLADNRIAELAEIDRPMLKDMLIEHDTGANIMELTGYTDDVIEDMMNETHEPIAGKTDDDAVPEPTESLTVKGDLWQLGNHRLLCGDATVITDVERLMGGEKADMVFTDPPYGKNIVKEGKVGADFGVAKKGLYKNVIGDIDQEIARKAIEIIINLNTRVMIFGGNYFIESLPQSDGWYIWDKRGNSGIRNTFADGEMVWCNFHTPVRIFTQLWNGMIREGEHEPRLHPTQKPVKVLSDILETSTNGNSAILDLFGGSGSTLIACEKLGRRCYMMEIDPHYCDVIINRWQNFTGEMAVKL